MMHSMADVFAADGPLARAIGGYRPRPEQLEMAQAVDEALNERKVLVVEAGTGTGKTLAYLVPALLSGAKVIVSTGTKTLQDQLFRKDLPLVRRALELPVRVALLKGRANYLCLHRFEDALADGRFDTREQAAQLQELARWRRLTRSGDLAEAPVPLLDEQLQARVTSTADNCLGGECPSFGECFLMEARRRAQEADLLVVNHHLLMADWALKEDGFGEVLPAADAMILDEAHQLPEVAAQFFGTSVSSRQLQELVRDARREYERDAGDVPALATALERLERALIELRLALGSSGRRGAWAQAADEPAVRSAVVALQRWLDESAALLAAQAERGPGLAACAKRAAALQDSLRQLLDRDDEQAVRWFETFAQSFVLRLTPLDVAAPLRRQLGRRRAGWVFTSATLAVDGDFGHFAERLGLDQPKTLCLQSSFDYANNALLYVPALPPPTAPNYFLGFLRAAEAVLQASGGRALMLFTSHRALREAAEYMRERLAYPLLVQGEAAQAELLERFRAEGNAVLLATGSFWEGVDVQGEALSCVIIDRLPFGSPGDPVLQAKIMALTAAQRNAFMEYQLPLAVIGLRQGVGRLIRGSDDRGVLMIGDTRILTRFYGRVFRNSLPAMPLTRDLGAVQAFFASSGAAERPLTTEG